LRNTVPAASAPANRLPGRFRSVGVRRIDGVCHSSHQKLRPIRRIVVSERLQRGHVRLLRGKYLPERPKLPWITDRGQHSPRHGGNQLPRRHGSRQGFGVTGCRRNVGHGPGTKQARPQARHVSPSRFVDVFFDVSRTLVERADLCDECLPQGMLEVKNFG
jgi:hypothetical protein